MTVSLPRARNKITATHTVLVTILLHPCNLTSLLTAPIWMSAHRPNLVLQKLNATSSNSSNQFKHHLLSRCESTIPL